MHKPVRWASLDARATNTESLDTRIVSDDASPSGTGNICGDGRA